MGSATADLSATLSDLDRWIRTNRPDLYPRFRPGLQGAQLDELSRQLRPYYLPAELITLYSWHDGWQDVVDGDYQPLLPDATFNSLSEAIAQYELWWNTLGSNGWHPLWFPAFGDQSGELVALQLAPDRPADRVFAYHSELDLSPSYDSVAALFATTLECWQEGLLPNDPMSFPPAIRLIAARHSPLSRTPQGGYREEISRASTEKWPEAWKEVLGLAPLQPAASDFAVTIADYLADPESGRPIHAEVRPESGSGDWIAATAMDGTGAVSVELTRGMTENFRELARPGRYELWLTVHPERAHAFLATRVVPL